MFRSILARVYSRADTMATLKAKNAQNVPRIRVPLLSAAYSALSGVILTGLCLTAIGADHASHIYPYPGRAPDGRPV